MNQAPKKKGRKPKTDKKKRTNILVYREFRDRLIAVHRKSGERFIYKTLERAIELLEKEVC